MIASIRMPDSRSRDWHNYDYLNRGTWLAWPWPEPEREALRQRISRMLGHIAGVIASLPPDWQHDRAESRP